MFPYKFLSILALILSISACTDDNNEPQIEPAKPGLVELTVLDYSPAPGQFINDAPEYENGDNAETIRLKAQEALNNGELISLGAFGGSITVKLNRPITRSIGGDSDFRILGNAFLHTAETATPILGSSEPGIVMVMSDSNNNGIADDTWYVLAGDQFDQAVECTVTYTNNSAANDNSKFVYWEDDKGNSGYITRNALFHHHSYFPLWSDNTSLTFSGLRLPDNGFLDKTANVYRQYTLNGYADSWPNISSRSGLSLHNARTLNGQTADVQRIDFVRIYTAVLQCCGNMGECSTEIAGIEALH